MARRQRDTRLGESEYTETKQEETAQKRTSFGIKFNVP